MEQDRFERVLRRYNETLARFGVSLPIVDWLDPGLRARLRCDEDDLCCWVVRQFIDDLEAFELIIEQVLRAREPRWVARSASAQPEQRAAADRPACADGPAPDPAPAPAALTVDPLLCLAIVVDGKFHLTIEDEDPLEFTLTNNYGTVVSDDHEVRMEFLVSYEVMGFEEIDRGNLGRTCYKLNQELSGPWRALVGYRDWILRAFDESATHWLVLAVGDGAREIGLAPVPGMRIHFGWLPKAETRLEHRWEGVAKATPG